MFQMKTSHTDPDTQFSGKESKIRELRLEPLTGRSLKYCTDACLRRCLEARNWNVEKAKKMLEETLKWRSMYKPEEIRWVSIRSKQTVMTRQVNMIVQTTSCK
ncbi:unnamed protein product [Cuscuta epithymum]|uniref:CRAL/TRIO N-terminal domain-containing protein n=1 Tax=Cuscuta epithymum TaxID=186058 RepID=A0AAV0GGF7_9ASTE|nr:unnamed protein product [Cuscuta epithymum]CAH9147004.1 unnamed protein product [Cuscuta epithymum]